MASAASKVFATVELLEQILLNLVWHRYSRGFTPYELFRLQRLNRLAKDLIGTSPALQIALGLCYWPAPSTKSKLTRNSRCLDFSGPFHRCYWGTLLGRSEPHIAILFEMVVSEHEGLNAKPFMLLGSMQVDNDTLSKTWRDIRVSNAALTVLLVGKVQLADTRTHRGPLYQELAEFGTDQVTTADVVRALHAISERSWEAHMQQVQAAASNRWLRIDRW